MMRFTLVLISFLASVQAFAPPAAMQAKPSLFAAAPLEALRSSISSQDVMGSSNGLYPAWASIASGTSALVDRVVDKVKFKRKQSSKADTKNFYVRFAQQNPFLNNLLIASFKSGAADFMAQTVIGGAALTQLHLSRSALFMVFGAVYCGAFQYLYQVCLFSKLFRDVEGFTQQSWGQKLRDRAGLTTLVAQTAMDLTVLAAAYLPVFYVFQASVFSTTMDPLGWVRTGLSRYQANFVSDALNILRIWLPADLLCFSVPMYLRLPVRHGIGFAWTAYLSFMRGGM